MKKLRSNQRFFLRNWPETMLCVIAGTIPLTTGMGNITLIAGFLLALVMTVKTKVKLTRGTWVAFLFPLLFFAWITVSALFSNDLAAGLKQVDKALLYPLISIVFLIYRQRSAISLKKVLVAFSILTSAAHLVYIFSGINSVYPGENTTTFSFMDFQRFLINMPYM